MTRTGYVDIVPRRAPAEKFASISNFANYCSPSVAWATTLSAVNYRPQRVAVLGASNDPDRYSYRAIEMLRQHGHHVLPVTPKAIQLPGLTVYPDLRHTPPPIDTVTLYVNPKVVESLADEITAVQPARVIFNPGTEHPDMAKRFQAAGITTLEACTLVLLGTGQFD